MKFLELNNQLNDFEIVNTQERSVLQVRNIPGEWDEATDTDNIDAKSIAQLNHWFSTIPTGATTLAGHSNSLMTCSFEYSQLIQAKDGSGAIGAIRQSGSNKIGAQARFQEAENLKSMVNTSLIFNIASQLVAQKHLADINERLQNIENQVSAVLEFLEESRRMEIKTFRELLKTIGQSITQGDDIPSTILQTLATKKYDARKATNHIRHDIEKIHKEIEDFNTNKWFSSNDLRTKLQKKIDKAADLQNQYLQSMQCLLIANLILYIKQDGNRVFINEKDEYLAELHDKNGIIHQWESINRTLDYHLNKINPIFELASSTNANTLLIKKNISKADYSLKLNIDQITEISTRITRAQNPQIQLEIINGKINRGRYLN